MIHKRDATSSALAGKRLCQRPRVHQPLRWIALPLLQVKPHCGVEANGLSGSEVIATAYKALGNAADKLGVRRPLEAKLEGAPEESGGAPSPTR